MWAIDVFILYFRCMVLNVVQGVLMLAAYGEHESNYEVQAPENIFHGTPSSVK